MFERFTDRARQSILDSQSEAVEHHHDFIGTEHVLIGLLRVGDGLAHQLLTAAQVELEPLRGKVTARLAELAGPSHRTVSHTDALASIGIDLDSVKASMEAAFGPGALQELGSTPAYTPAAKDALQAAWRRGQMLRHRYIGTEHVLLGILADHDTVACQSLADLGVDLTDLERRTVDAAAPSEARVDAAWQAITDLHLAVGLLPVEGRDQAAPVVAQLARAHGDALGREQADVTALAERTAATLEHAVAAARDQLRELGIEL